ncbi:hypothetical protein RF11_03101 [Thelohanellus kitauei]|uniref:Uncharacterized protein n=1 Tax=Thelohanellus kitauei TaxID=669202 RepID=A0A0C2IGW9_THEKT|nr:hypothetical protein RF11_03101 [Thelohanellus kitauei]
MSIRLFNLFLTLLNILQAKADIEKQKMVNRSIGNTTFWIQQDSYAYIKFAPANEDSFNLEHMNIFEYKASALIIKFEKNNTYRTKSFSEIKCNFVDTIEHIQISNCKVSGIANNVNIEKQFFFDGEWKIDKKTKYEIENLKKEFFIDPSQSQLLRLYFYNMTIEPQSYTRICSLKQTAMDFNENDFSCVNISPSVDSTNTIHTSTPNNEVVFNHNISKTNKLWWSMIILIVPVTILLTIILKRRLKPSEGPRA